MASTEIEAKCPLGNGICPKECPNYEAALKLTVGLGEKFDPFIFRLSVAFGDVNPDINVLDVERVIGNCKKEGHNKSPKH